MDKFLLLFGEKHPSPLKPPTFWPPPFPQLGSSDWFLALKFSTPPFQGFFEAFSIQFFIMGRIGKVLPRLPFHFPVPPGKFLYLVPSPVKRRGPRHLGPLAPVPLLRLFVVHESFQFFLGYVPPWAPSLKSPLRGFAFFLVFSAPFCSHFEDTPLVSLNTKGLQHPTPTTNHRQAKGGASRGGCVFFFPPLSFPC